jgi:hypothetical protein
LNPNTARFAAGQSVMLGERAFNPMIAVLEAPIALGRREGLTTPKGL